MIDIFITIWNNWIFNLKVKRYKKAIKSIRELNKLSKWYITEKK